MIALGGDGEAGDRRRLDAEHRAALAGGGDQIVLGGDEAAPVVGRDQGLCPGDIGPDRDNGSRLLDVGHQPQRLAERAPARQFRGVERERLAVARQHQQFRGRLGEERALQAVVALEGRPRDIGDMAFHRANPTFSRQQHGDRLALDQRLGEIHHDIGRRLEARAALADLALRSVFFLGVADFMRDHLPLFDFGAEQRLDLPLLLGQLGLFLAKLHFLQPAQRAQPRVEDIVGLSVVEREAGDQSRLRLVLLAHDADHLVEIEVNDHHAGEQFEPALDRGEPVARAAQQHVAAMVEPLLQAFHEADHARRDAIDQHVHIDRDARFQLAELEQLLHQHFRRDRAGARLQHDADVLGGFVAHVGQQRRLLLVDEFGQRLDQPRFLHAIGNFGDDGDPAAAPEFLFLPARAHAKPPAPGAINFGDDRPFVHHHAAGGKIRAGHEMEQRVDARLGVDDQIERGVEQFRDIMRRDACRHADRDALRAIRQQVGHGRRQHDRLQRVAGIIVAPVDRVLVDPLQQEAGEIGQARLGVAIGGGVIAVDIAEIALALDEGIARGEILRQPHQRLVDRLIAVRMERAHHVADDLRAFLERRARIELQYMHPVQDAPMHRLQPVARVR